MPDKKALVGVQDDQGNIVPQPWDTGDTLVDQDGAGIYTTANPPPASSFPTVRNHAVGGGGGTILNYTWNVAASYVELFVAIGVQGTGLGAGHYTIDCTTGVIRGGSMYTNISFGGGSAAIANGTGPTINALVMGVQSLSFTVTLGSRNILVSSSNFGVAHIIEHE